MKWLPQPLALPNTDSITCVVWKNVQHQERATETTLCRKVGVGAAADLVTYVHTTRLAVILSNSFLSRSCIDCVYMHMHAHTSRKLHIYTCMYKWHTHRHAWTVTECHMVTTLTGLFRVDTAAVPKPSNCMILYMANSDHSP